jgi:Tfp pilus assembly protein PilX
MKNAIFFPNNEKGSIIVIALLVLSVLTIIAFSATSNSIYETQIIRNEHLYHLDFYLADSGWKEAAMWLENLAGPPSHKNPGGDNIVKNFGFNTASADPAPSDLNALTPDNASLSQYGVPYWYQVTYVQDVAVAGSGPGWREFSYRARSNANQTQEVEVTLSKVYKVGY